MTYRSIRKMDQRLPLFSELLQTVVATEAELRPRSKRLANIKRKLTRTRIHVKYFNVVLLIWIEEIFSSTRILGRRESLMGECCEANNRPSFSLRSKRFCAVREQRITGRYMERLKEGGGGGEERKRLQTKPLDFENRPHAHWDAMLS